MQGVLGDLLSDDLAVRRDPDEHRPAALVQKPAERLHRLVQFACGALELQGLGLAYRDELFDRDAIHREPPASRSMPLSRRAHLQQSWHLDPGIQTGRLIHRSDRCPVMSQPRTAS